MRNSKNKHPVENFSDNYFAAFDLQAEFIYVINPDTFTIVYINKAVRDYYPGVSPVGMTCHEFFMDDDSPCRNCPAMKFLQTGERNFSQIERPDGMTVFANASLLHYGGQNFILVSCTDISSVKQEIEEERNQYRDAVLSEAICTYQADITDNMIYRMPIFNAPEYTITTSIDFPVCYDDYLTIWNVKYDIVHEAKQGLMLQSSESLRKAFENGEKNIQIDYKIKHNDSYRRKMILLSRRKSDGHILANVVIHDTTDSAKLLMNYQKLAAEESAKKDMRNLFSSISCGILQYKRDTFEIVFANKAALDILGYASVAEMQADFPYGVANTTVEEDRHIIKEAVEMLKPGEFADCKYRIRHYNSPDVIYCYGTLQLIESADGSVTVLRSLLDITEREMMTQISKSYQLTKSLMNAYIQVCSFDIVHDTYSLLKDYTGSGPVEGTGIKNFIARRLSALPEESVAKLAAFFDISSLNERMKTKDTESIEFIDADGNWHRGQLIVCSRNSLNEVSSITFASQDINTERLAALENQRYLENQLTFLKSIADIYLSMYRGNFTENTFTVLNGKSGVRDQNRPLKYVWESWCAKDFTPESYEENKEFLNFNTLQKRLTEQGSLSDDVLTIANGWVNVLIVPYIRNEAGLVTDALFLVRCIDEIKRRELRHAESLLQAYKITKSLTNAYYSCFNFDFEHQTCLTLKDDNSLELLDGTVDINLVIKRWIERLPDISRQTMQSFMDFSTIDGRLQDRDFVSVEFVNEMGKLLKGTLIASEKDRNNHILSLTFITENLDEQRQKERDYLTNLESAYQITKSISDAYIQCCSVDLETRKYTVFKNTEYLSSLQSENFEATLGAWINTLDEDNQNKIRSWFDFSTLDERMKNKDIISIEYQEPHGMWLRAYIIVSSRSQDGKIKAVTLCVQDITEEKKNQIEKEIAIQERVSFLSSIERIFHSMYLMDFANNSLQMLNTGSETMSTVQPLKQIWNTWCDNDLSLEILHEHQQFLNIDTLPDRLKKQGVLSDDILSKMNGWQNFMFVPYKHDDDGNVVEALFLTRIIDELKKAELRQQEALRIANRAAEHDELTGLYNRYGFNKKIDQLYLKPEKKTVAVIMMDLDYFKQVNDVYGHDAGDLVLKNVACKLVSVFGDTSLYCRWGGEEFNTFVYDESIDPVQIAEELRKVVERSIIMHENKEIKITLSIGVCITHDMSNTKISKLINTADKCMYISKRNGKNRVTVEQV